MTWFSIVYTAFDLSGAVYSVCYYTSNCNLLVGVDLITLIIWSILIKIELKREIMKLGHGTHRQFYLIYFIFPVSMIIFLVVRVL